MKLALNLSLFLFLFGLITFGHKSFSLTNYKIQKICKKAKKESICIKNLKEKKSNLQKGNFIEIPVIPFER
tara:strand:+ start:325 stop:537 length:213 start_codon:yes stop_codon:yes gene_type:complete